MGTPKKVGTLSATITAEETWVTGNVMKRVGTRLKERHLRNVAQSEALGGEVRQGRRFRVLREEHNIVAQEANQTWK